MILTGNALKLLFDQCVIHNYFFNFQFQFLKLIVVIVWYNKITISPRGRVGGGGGGVQCGQDFSWKLCKNYRVVGKSNLNTLLVGGMVLPWNHTLHNLLVIVIS